MGYNPYFPAYQPYNGYYPQIVQQPQMVQQPQPQNQNQIVQNPSTSGIIWVSGLNEAQMFPLAPNNAVALWEQSGKTIYLKSADATGKPSMKIYDLVERSENTPTASAPQDDKSINYATKDELSAIAGAIKNVLSDIEVMKNDLYGVAGRKKAVKKEVTEDDA